MTWAGPLWWPPLCGSLCMNNFIKHNEQQTVTTKSQGIKRRQMNCFREGPDIKAQEETKSKEEHTCLKK